MPLALAGRLTPAWVFVAETIPPPHLAGALGMPRATMDSARVGGALAGAGLSTVLGIGHTYLFVITFYLASLALTFGVARARPVPDPTLPLAGERGSRGWRELREGLAHVVRTPRLHDLRRGRPALHAADRDQVARQHVATAAARAPGVRPATGLTRALRRGGPGSGRRSPARSRRSPSPA